MRLFFEGDGMRETQKMEKWLLCRWVHLEVLSKRLYALGH